MKRVIRILIAVVAILLIPMVGYGELTAYHTKLAHSPTDFVGKYPDIVVTLGEGEQLEFARRTGYLPLWRTSGETYSFDDFYPTRNEDHTFAYNYVRLIENTPEKVVVHWRYMRIARSLNQSVVDKDLMNVGVFQGVIHEMFTITADGKVTREIRDANVGYEQWVNPGSRTRQTIQLSEEGVAHGPVSWPADAGERAAVAGSPVVKVEGLPEPVLAWHFDEGLEAAEDNTIFERVRELSAPLDGLMAYYKKGVSGTSLALDGYYSGVTVKSVPAASVNTAAVARYGTGEAAEGGFVNYGDAMSIECWLALDAYPYNNAPILQHATEFGKSGYYFGVNAYGYLTFTLDGNELVADETIALWEWAHVAVTLGDGKVALYLNGDEVATGTYSGSISVPDAPISIGRNIEKSRPTDYVRTPLQNLPSLLGLPGLIDELKVYGVGLSMAEVEDAYAALEPSDLSSPLAKGVLPGENGVADAFGATYKTLSFHETWDRMWRVSDQSDVVVKFDDNPGSVVYWRGTNYAPNWVADNNRWMSDQSSEVWGPHGCSEHMGDKQVRHSRIRVIENTPARVRVHWRYPCVDVSYYCSSPRAWTDEYHTIYPDGTGVRYVYWDKGAGEPGPGFQDIQFLTSPGETALDVVELQAMSLMNMEGEYVDLLWEGDNGVPDNTLPDANIELLHSKSEHEIFSIFQGGYITPWGHTEQSIHTNDPFAGPWNHWPVHLLPSDGRFAVAHDRVTHFALGANDSAPEFGSMVHYGFTQDSITSLLPTAKAWVTPPNVGATKGVESSGYDKAERAFVFTRTGSDMQFVVNATSDSPVVNPCFVIKNWTGRDDAKVTVNGEPIYAGAGFRQGVVFDTDGTPTKVIWLELSATDTTEIRVRRS